MAIDKTSANQNSDPKNTANTASDKDLTDDKVGQWRKVVLQAIDEYDNEKKKPKGKITTKSRPTKAILVETKLLVDTPVVLPVKPLVVKAAALPAIKTIPDNIGTFFGAEEPTLASKKIKESLLAEPKKIATPGAKGFFAFFGKKPKTSIKPASFQKKLIAKPQKKVTRGIIEPTPRPKEHLLKRIVNFFITLILLLVVIVLSGVIMVGAGLYKYQWDDQYTNQLIKIVPYPVAVVNNKFLSYHEFRENVLALRRYYQRQEQLSGGVQAMPPIEKIREDVLRRMITNELIRQLAGKSNIAVSQKEINDKYSQIGQDAGGEKKVAEIINDLYGWEPEVYKKRVLEISLLADKLDNFLLFSSDINSKEKGLIQEAYGKLKSEIAESQTIEEKSRNFIKSALQYDQSDNKGSFGLAKVSTLPNSIKSFASSAKVGDISQVIRIRNGYMILFLETKSGKNEAEAQVDLKQIFIKAKGLDDMLKEEQTKAQVRRFFR